jgi:hypothetical protein
MRDSGPARDGTQLERLNPFFFQDISSRPEQRHDQIPVVVGALPRS